MSKENFLIMIGLVVFFLDIIFFNTEEFWDAEGQDIKETDSSPVVWIFLCAENKLLFFVFFTESE